MGFFRFPNPGPLRISSDNTVAGGISDPLNLAVFAMFVRLGIGEREGIGLSDVYSVWERQGWIEPQPHRPYEVFSSAVRFPCNLSASHISSPYSLIC